MKTITVYTAGVKPREKSDNFTVKFAESPSPANVTIDKGVLKGVTFINSTNTVCWGTISAKDADKIAKNPDVAIKVQVGDEYDPNGINRCEVISLG